MDTTTVAHIRCADNHVGRYAHDSGVLAEFCCLGTLLAPFDPAYCLQSAMPARVRFRSPKFRGATAASVTCALQETLLDLPEPVTHFCHPIPRSDFEKGDLELQR